MGGQKRTKPKQPTSLQDSTSRDCSLINCSGSFKIVFSKIRKSSSTENWSQLGPRDERKSRNIVLLENSFQNSLELRIRGIIAHRQFTDLRKTTSCWLICTVLVSRLQGSRILLVEA